jgi:uncharacterized protein
MTQQQERFWGMLCHITSLVGFLGIPFGNILGPLVTWLIKKNESSFVDHAGKEAMNFQIAITIYSIIAGLLCFIVIGIPLLGILLIGNIVCSIIAAIKTNEGQDYQYKYIFRLIK